jgi:hypothetical protein
MALRVGALVCGMLRLSVAIDVQHLRSGQHAEVSPDHATKEGFCERVQPASMLQIAIKPWDGEYKTKERCLETAILPNTAEASKCNIIYWVILLSTFFVLLCAFAVFTTCPIIGSCIFLVPFMVAWYYLITTGLFADYISGAMSWEASAKGVVPHNVSLECLGFVQTTYVLTVLIVIYGTIFLVLTTCIVGPSKLLTTRMAADTAVTKQFLSEEDKNQIDSQAFQVKCIKAFRDADADGNGTLDMSELQNVALSEFGLTDDEKKYVQESMLFKEAFEKCDEDKSSSIDQTEFVQVMKFIVTKAKYGAAKSEA